MSAPALAPVQIRQEKAQSRAWIYCIAAVYALLVAAVIQRHEPWADEAQGWLLARDAPLFDLWTKLLHYEGSPGLWQTLLHVLIRLGLSYSAYNFVSAALALSAVWMILRYSPFPLFVRLFLPFTYYLCYQYSVVARSYALMAPLLFATAMLYKQARRRPILFHALLCLIAGISVHGVVVSGCIWLTTYGLLALRWTRLAPNEQRRLMLAAAVYGLVVASIMLCAWPAKDVAFAEERGSAANFQFLWDITKITLSEAFTGYWLTSVAVIALSAPFLWRGGGWLFFSLVSVILFLFGTVVYAAVWHCGILFLAWLFAIWISAQKTSLTRETIAAILIATAVQCYWTVQAVRYDWTNAYSGSLAAARYLKQEPPPVDGVYAIGYPTLAIQPYFSSNIYSDYHQHASRAYWDWSKRNPAKDAAGLISPAPPAQVLVGYTNAMEREHWAGVFGVLGYELTHRFEGATFWRTHIFESQSYDLYRRVSDGDSHAASQLEMGNPASEAQLLTGFYGVEENAWRWTAKKFSAVLKTPPGSAERGATLTLRIYVSPGQIEKLGPVTLIADVSGYRLSPRVFQAPGAYVYSEDVPAQALKARLVEANFQLDKAARGVKNDRRELGIVVSALGLASEPQR